MNSSDTTAGARTTTPISQQTNRRFPRLAASVPLLVLLWGPAAATVRAEVWTNTLPCSSNLFWTAARVPVALGYRAISLSSGTNQLSAVWLRDYAPSLPPLLVAHAALQSNLTACLGDGYRPAALAVWGSIPSESYLLSYVRDGKAGSIFARLSQAELVSLASGNAGARVAWLSGSLEGEEVRYAGVLANDGRPGRLETGLDKATLEARVLDYQEAGYRPVAIVGVAQTTGLVYAASWVLDPQPRRWTNRVGLASAERNAFIASLPAQKLRTEFISQNVGSDTCNIQAVEDLPSVWTITGNLDSGLEVLDRTMTTAMRSANCTRAALAVSLGGRLKVSRAYTYHPTNVPATQPTNLFRLASISKTLTATTLMGLIEAGRLQLDDKLGKFIDLSDVLDARWTNITIRHLLQHRAGWNRTQTFDPLFIDTTISAALGVPLPITKDHIITYMKTRQRLYSEPGGSYSYSNFGYLLLGKVVEQVTQQDYETFVRANVLAPLGIYSARLGGTLRSQQLPGEVEYEEGTTLNASVMSPERLPVARPYGASNLDNADACGRWVCSAEDLVRYCSIFTQKTNCALLLPETLNSMWAPAPAENLPTTGYYSYYSCGWHVEGTDKASPQYIFHGGDVSGTQTLLMRQQNGICWAVLFNTHNYAGTSPLAALSGGQAIESAIAAVTRWPTNDLFDVDADGLPDSYERARFGTLTASDGAGDRDGDGLSDYAEWVAMSDPSDPGDGPQFKSRAGSQGRPGLEIVSHSGRTYSVQSSSGLSQDWTQEAEFARFNGDGFTRELPFNGSAPSGFYRLAISLRAQPPPAP